MANFPGPACSDSRQECMVNSTAIIGDQGAIPADTNPQGYCHIHRAPILSGKDKSARQQGNTQWQTCKH